MANIKVKIDYPISDGTKLRFRTPCESTSVEGLVVTYPVTDGVGYASKTFTFADANGNELSGVGNVFTADVLIGVFLDVTKGRAYIKNADTNSYIENIKATVQRLEEERQEIFAKAGKTVEKLVEDCKNAVKRMDEDKQTIFAEVEKTVEECNEATNTLNRSAKEIRSSGFVEALKELNNGDKFTFWTGTQEEYEAQKDTIPANTLVLITDDNTYDELTKNIQANTEAINAGIEKLSVDYIVEQGKVDGWEYRKWNSGNFECWCSYGDEVEFTKLTAHDFGKATVNLTIPSGITGSIRLRTCNVSVNTALSWAVSVGASYEDITFGVLSAAYADTKIRVVADIYAKGTWS